MKNTYAIILVVLVLLGVVFLVTKNNKPEDQMEADKSEVSGVNDNALDDASSEAVENNTEVTVTTPSVSTSLGDVKQFTVTGKNFSFSPSTIKVNKGDKVRINFDNTQGFHDFVIDEYGAATKQSQAPFKEVVEFIADKSGSFEFYCSVGTHRHMGMKGTLIVK